jgi:hypothetical protein
LVIGVLVIRVCFEFRISYQFSALKSYKNRVTKARHSGENRNPGPRKENWIPASAGMTAKANRQKSLFQSAKVLPNLK